MSFLLPFTFLVAPPMTIRWEGFDKLDKPGIRCLDSKEQLATLVKHHPLPPLDWDKFSLVVLTVRVPTSDSAVQVVSVDEAKDALWVNYTISSPTAADLSQAVLKTVAVVVRKPHKTLKSRDVTLPTLDP
jgi:hypothetical protein